MNSIAKAYLRADFVNHVDMIAVLADSDVRYAAPDGVVLHFEDIHFVSAVDDAAALRLLPLVTSDTYVISHNDALLAPLCQTHGYHPLVRCYNHAYLHAAPPACALPEDASLRPLTQADLPCVLAHYHSIDDPRYISERIDAGMYGVTVSGVLAGFIGIHNDHSMGLLEIFPEYQRLGLALALEAHLISELLKRGQLPFSQVQVDNTPSLKLQEKLGMTIGRRPLVWLGRDASL